MKPFLIAAALMVSLCPGMLPAQEKPEASKMDPPKGDTTKPADTPAATSPETRSDAPKEPAASPVPGNGRGGAGFKATSPAAENGPKKEETSEALKSRLEKQLEESRARIQKLETQFEELQSRVRLLESRANLHGTAPTKATDEARDRFTQLSEDGKRRFSEELRNNREKFQAASPEDRQKQVNGILDRLIAEDKGDPPKVPSPKDENNVPPLPTVPPPASKPAQARPSEEDRNRFMALSEEARKRFIDKMRDSREKMQAASPEERAAFVRRIMEEAMAADKAGQGAKDKDVPKPAKVEGTQDQIPAEGGPKPPEASPKTGTQNGAPSPLDKQQQQEKDGIAALSQEGRKRFIDELKSSSERLTNASPDERSDLIRAAMQQIIAEEKAGTEPKEIHIDGAKDKADYLPENSAPTHPEPLPGNASRATTNRVRQTFAPLSEAGRLRFAAEMHASSEKMDNATIEQRSAFAKETYDRIMVEEANQKQALPTAGMLSAVHPSGQDKPLSDTTARVDRLVQDFIATPSGEQSPKLGEGQKKVWDLQKVMSRSVTTAPGNAESALPSAPAPPVDLQITERLLALPADIRHQVLADAEAAAENIPDTLPEDQALAKIRQNLDSLITGAMAKYEVAKQRGK